MKTFAVITDGIVSNIIVGDSLESLQKIGLQNVVEYENISVQIGTEYNETTKEFIFPNIVVEDPEATIADPNAIDPYAN
jgi:hypothetical protein